MVNQRSALALRLMPIVFGLFLPCTGAAPLEVAAQLKDTQLDVTVAGKLFTSYRFDPKLKKPYLWPVVGPESGKSVTVESVPSQYPHHNSIWLGCDRVNGQNFWQPHGQIENGQIKSSTPVLVRARGDSVCFTDECVWQKPGAEPVIRDERRITIAAPASGLRVLDFEVTLHMLTDVSVQKTNHSLFSVRMMPELSVKSGGTLVNAQGHRGEKQTFGVASPWCDFVGTRGGITEGVALFQHPSNRWYPSKWFTRDYGFMSPTPMFWPASGQETTFAGGETLTLRYRIVVHTGSTAAAGIAKWFAEYAGADAARNIPQLDPLATYLFGGSRAALVQFEESLRQTPPGERAPHEQRLLQLLGDPKATLDGKRYACTMLGGVGADESVPALETLLTDAKLASLARMALTQIGSEAAVAALRDAIPAAGPVLKQELVTSLGELRDVASLPTFQALAGGADPHLVLAALDALAQLGSKDALAALRRVTLSEPVRAKQSQAIVTCAERVARAGDREAAAQACLDVFTSSAPEATRAGAAVVLARTRGKASLPTVTDLLKQDNAVLRGAAAECIASLPAEPDVVASLCDALPSLPPPGQVILIQALAQRGDRDAAPSIRTLMKSDDGNVRTAACAALGQLGGPEDVPELVALLEGDSRMRAAAADALTRFSADGVSRALLTALEGATTPATRVACLEVVHARGEWAGGTLLLELARDPDRKVRREALKVIADLGTAKELGPLIALLDGDIGAAADRQAYEQCVATLCRRWAGDGEPSRPCLDALPKANAAGRASLCTVLGRLADEDVLPTLVKACGDPEQAVREAAIRALASWPRESAFDPLLEVARSADALTHSVLALRGCRRLLDSMGDLPDEQLKARFDACKQAARRDEERSLFKLDLVGVAVHDLKVKSDKAYVVQRAGLKPGAKWATDRNYTFTDVPVELLRATYIQTPMNDKYTPAQQELLSFRVDTAVTAYVCYDHRCSKLPEWLQAWERTNVQLDSTAPGSQLILYRKAFEPGTIVLGGNKAPGVAAMYVVCVQPGG